MPVETARRVCLVRHGITPPQLQGRYCGHSDPPLAPDGERQMLALRAVLAPQVRPSAVIYCSDRVRSIASAALLLDRPARVLAELGEIDFGAWEGMRFDDTGCSDVEALRSLDYQYPGGESARMLIARVASVLPSLLQNAPEVVLLAHAGSLAAVRLLLTRAPSDTIHACMLDHGAYLWLERSGAEWRLS